MICIQAQTAVITSKFVMQSGKSVVVEYVNDEMKVVYPDKNYQCATNFLLTQPDAEFNFGQDATKLLMKN